MDGENHIEQETPDMDFDDNPAELDTPDIDFSNINETETPDLDFDEPVTEAANKSHERFPTEDSDIDDLDEPDQYVEDEDDGDDTNNELVNNNDSESAPVERGKGEPKPKQSSDHRLIHLPSARVKHIMKIDPDVSLITGECTFLVTKATELFIESLAREAFLHTAQAKKKTVQKRDVDAAIENVESLVFLEGMMNF